jgi:hypothetical protein
MIDYEKFKENGELKWWVQYFKKFEHLLLNALEYGNGTHSLEDVAMALDKDEMQLWPGRNTVLVTKILTHPQKRVIHVFLAAGNLEEVFEILPYVEQHGKNESCSEITMIGRVGWEKVLKRVYACKTNTFLSIKI